MPKSRQVVHAQTQWGSHGAKTHSSQSHRDKWVFGPAPNPGAPSSASLTDISRDMRATREPLSPVTLRKPHSGAGSESRSPEASHRQSYKPPCNPQLESATPAAHLQLLAPARTRRILQSLKLRKDSLDHPPEAAPVPCVHSASVQPSTYPRNFPRAIRSALTFASGTPRSCRRARETSTSEISSQSALCIFRSITAAVFCPFSSVKN